MLLSLYIVILVILDIRILQEYAKPNTNQSDLYMFITGPDPVPVNTIHEWLKGHKRTRKHIVNTSIGSGQGPTLATRGYGHRILPNDLATWEGNT